MFTVPINLGKRGATALRGNAVWGESNPNFVGGEGGSLHDRSGSHFVGGNFGDRTAPDVVTPAKERACSQKTSECAIAQGGDRIGKGPREGSPLG